jgi:fibronectin-binding autotransporter adhesin
LTIAQDAAVTFDAGTNPQLDLGAGGLTISDNNGAQVSASANFVINAAQTWSNNGTGVLTITGGSTNSSSTYGANVGLNIANALTLGSGNVSFTSGSNSGAGGVIIGGATVSTSQAGAFGTGALSLTSGSLSSSISSSSSNPIANAYTLGGAFTFPSGSAHVYLSGAGTVSGTPTITLSDSPGSATGSGTNLTGGVTLTSNLTFTGTGNATVSSAIVEDATARSLTLDGNYSGTLFLSEANSFSGGLFLNGGTASISSTFNALGAVPASPGTAVTINSATLAFTTSLTGNNANRQFALGSAADGSTNGGTFSVSSTSTVDINSVVRNAATGSGVGFLVKAGSGTLLLSCAGGNSYSGGTTITAGLLLANNTSNSATGSGAVAIYNTGALGGTGFVSGAVSVGSTSFTTSNGTITGGGGTSTASLIGTLNTGVQTWNTGGTYVVKVDGSTETASTGGSPASDAAAAAAGTPSGSSDELILNGGLSASSTGLNISLLAVNGTAEFTPGSTYSFVIANIPTSSTSPEAFAAILADLNASGSNVSGTYGLFDEPTGSGDDLVLTFTDAAPEPASLTLIGAAACPLLLARRRRRSEAKSMDA